MHNELQTFYGHLKDLVERSTDGLKEKVNTLLHQTSLSVAEWGIFIQDHPDTSKKEALLLGISYQFYDLTIHGVKFRMETRGINAEHILYMTVFTPQKVLLTYRSYEKKIPLTHRINIENLA